MNLSYRDPVDFYRTHWAEFSRLRASRTAEGDWIEIFLGHLPSGAEVLDVGCGSGLPIARRLADAGVSVTGIDPTPQFCELARRNVPEAAFIEMDMRELDLPQRFDGVIAWHSFFHLDRPQQRQTLHRFANHIREEGVVMFTSGTGNGEAINPFLGENLYHSSLDPDEYRTILKDCGFSVVRHRVEDAEAGGATIWLAKRDLSLEEVK